MPGGDLAVREPWRLALAVLAETGYTQGYELPVLASVDAQKREIVLKQIESGVNAPLTTSMGRLFDAIAALIGVRGQVNYEAQAAIELEAFVDHSARGSYPLEIEAKHIDYAPLVGAIIEDLINGVETGVIAARFHQSLVEVLEIICEHLRSERQLDTVVLSGGVWQNEVLVSRAVEQLTRKGFDVRWHRRVPTNDGGLALGQALVAAARTGAL